MKTTISYQDFEQLDLRVGMVKTATVPTWSEKLIQFEVDFGSELGTRTILSGVKDWYAPTDFIDKNFLFVVNLADRPMGPADETGQRAVSQGMMLMADTAEQPTLCPVPTSVEPGTIVR